MTRGVGGVLRPRGSLPRPGGEVSRDRGTHLPPGPLGRRSPERPLPQNPVELHFGADVQRVRVGLLQGWRWRHRVRLGREHPVSEALPRPCPPLSWDWKGQGGQREAVGTTSKGSSGRRRGSSRRAEPDAEGRGNCSQRLGRSSGAPPAGRGLRGEGSSAAGSQPPLSPTHPLPRRQPQFWWPGLAGSGR